MHAVTMKTHKSGLDIRAKLRDRRGDIYVQAMVWFWILFVLFVCIMEYSRLHLISKGVRDAVEQSVTSVAINNAYNSFNGVREGNSGAYILSGDDDWRENISTSDVVYKLTALLKLKTKDGEYLRMNPEGGTYEYKISDIQVTPDNAEFASNSEKAKYMATCTVTVPLSPGLGVFPPVALHLRHQSIYVALFE